MKVNLNFAIKDFQGKDIIENGNRVSAEDMCFKCLMAVYEEDRSLTGEQKYSLYKIGNKLEKDEDFTIEELATLKERVSRLNPLVVGQIWDALEGK